MGFAEYFEKNEQAGALLLQGMTSDALKNSLRDEVIGVAFDDSAVRAREGQATLEMCIRLLSRFYPTIALIPLGPRASQFVQVNETLAKSINPNIDILHEKKAVTRAIVVGNTVFTMPKRKKIPTFYLGSKNWIVKLSVSAPAKSGDSPNPFGAGVAACLGAANIFRSIFAKELRGAKQDVELSFSVLDLDQKAVRPKNPRYASVEIGDVYLVGAGAIGNGFIWALGRFESIGNLHIIDGERLESSNLQRYANANSGDVGQSKVELAGKWLSSNLNVTGHFMHWEQFLDQRSDWHLDTVAVAVDSAAARIQIQASLPKHVFNSWTNEGIAGTSRHQFLSKNACLACLYIPTAVGPSLDLMVLRALKLNDDPATLMEVRRRLETDVVNDLAYLALIAQCSGVPLQSFRQYEGKPLRTLYVEAICGGAVVEFGNAGNPARADVPMAFQSTLAGLLLAADVIAKAGNLRKPMPTVTQIDLLRPFPLRPSHWQQKKLKPGCICGDTDFIDSYREKYHA